MAACVAVAAAAVIRPGHALTGDLPGLIGIFHCCTMQVQVDPQKQRFLLLADGTRFSGSATPAALGMESGDVILALKERSGD